MTDMTTAPQTLDYAGIAARVPHSGNMCLLHGLLAWSASSITCSAISHRSSTNPLRAGGALLSANAIEYAAQAMALHGSLCAAPGSAPTPGFLASVRSVRLHAPRLDTAPGALRIQADKLAGDTQQALYAFAVLDEQGAALVDGRATVVLNVLP
jgi:predicted hotdog family 3-hydroxylacyl-ACP dehydratase